MSRDMDRLDAPYAARPILYGGESATGSFNMQQKLGGRTPTMGGLKRVTSGHCLPSCIVLDDVGGQNRLDAP